MNDGVASLHALPALQGLPTRSSERRPATRHRCFIAAPHTESRPAPSHRHDRRQGAQGRHARAGLRAHEGRDQEDDCGHRPRRQRRHRLHVVPGHDDVQDGALCTALRGAGMLRSTHSTTPAPLPVTPQSEKDSTEEVREGKDRQWGTRVPRRRRASLVFSCRATLGGDRPTAAVCTRPNPRRRSRRRSASSTATARARSLSAT